MEPVVAKEREVVSSEVGSTKRGGGGEGSRRGCSGDGRGRYRVGSVGEIGVSTSRLGVPGGNIGGGVFRKSAAKAEDEGERSVLLMGGCKGRMGKLLKDLNGLVRNNIKKKGNWRDGSAWGAVLGRKNRRR